MKTFVLVSLLLTTSMSKNLMAQAQFKDGYIISLQGDTINGKIKYRSQSKNYQACVFANEGGTKEYRPTDIQGYGYVKGQHYTSAYTNTSFLEALVLGEVNLYKMDKVYYLKKSGQDMVALVAKVLESKVNGKIHRTEDNKWKLLCVQVLGDCLEDPAARLKYVRLNEKTIVSLVSDYNLCRNHNFIDLKKDRPWTRVTYGVGIGATKSKIAISVDDNTFDYLPSKFKTTSFTVGIPLIFSFPRVTERLAFQSEFYFTNTTFSSELTINNEPVDTRHYHSSINLQTISTPLSLRIPVTQGVFSTYINLGANMDWHLKHQSRLRSELVDGDLVSFFPETRFLDVPSFQFGYLGGLGISKNFSAFRIDATIRQIMMLKMNTSGNFDAIQSKTALLLIIYRR
jgi:hypothetical protein